MTTSAFPSSPRACSPSTSMAATSWWPSARLDAFGRFSHRPARPHPAERNAARSRCGERLLPPAERARHRPGAGGADGQRRQGRRRSRSATRMSCRCCPSRSRAEALTDLFNATLPKGGRPCQSRALAPLLRSGARGLLRPHRLLLPARRAPDGLHGPHDRRAPLLPEPRADRGLRHQGEVHLRDHAELPALLPRVARDPFLAPISARSSRGR